MEVRDPDGNIVHQGDRPTAEYWEYLRAAWVQYNRHDGPHPLTWKEYVANGHRG